MKFLGSIMKNKLIRALSSSAFVLTTLTQCMSQPDFDKKIRSLIDESVPLIYQKELKQRMEKEEVILLDSRSPEEYEVSHLPGAKYVGYDEFSSESVERLDRDKPVVVYCSVGYRSEKIGEKLQEMGFEEVYNLYGGIFDWKNNKNAVVNNRVETDSVHTYNRNWSKWLLEGVKVY